MVTRRTPGLRPALVMVAVALQFSWAATPASAQDGEYVIEPWQGRYVDVKVQPWDQKIVVAGHPGIAIGRYDFDGVPDASFGSGGFATVPGGIAGRGLTLQSDGKAVIAGDFNGNGHKIGVARFNTNGTLDSGFGSGGWTTISIPNESWSWATDVALQSTGKIVVVGEAESSWTLARFTTSGLIDSGKSAFGDQSKGKAVGYTIGPSGFISAIAIQADDKIIALGSARGSAGWSLVVLARYTPDGVLDRKFGSRGYSVLSSETDNDAFAAHSVALQADGKIVLVGATYPSSTSVDGSRDMVVARCNADGTFDSGFGGGSGSVRLDINGTDSQTFEHGTDVVIQPDGKIVAVGYTRGQTVDSSGDNSVLVVRLNSNGSLDETFGTGGYKLVAPPDGPEPDHFFGYGVDLQLDGSIIVVGAEIPGETAEADDHHPLLMRFDP